MTIRSALLVSLCAWWVLALQVFAEEKSLRLDISNQVFGEEHNWLQLQHRTSEGPFVGLDFNSSTTNVTNPYDAWRQLPDWLRYLSGCVILLMGLVITFYGVRFLDFSVVILGGFIPAFVTFGTLGATIPNDNPDKTVIVYVTSFCVWLVAGILLLCCLRLAVFIMGFALGAIVALILNPILLKYVWQAEPLANAVIWVVVFGLIGAVLALCLERPLLILSTAVGGSFSVVGSIAAMTGNLNIGATTPDGSITDTTWEDWAVLGGIIALSILGVVIQLCCTAPNAGTGGYQKLD